jgi:hypothetical protein
MCIHNAFLHRISKLHHQNPVSAALITKYILCCCWVCRSHPDEVRKFYKLVDEFHRMWDVVTEFDSLSHLASQMVPVSKSYIQHLACKASKQHHLTRAYKAGYARKAVSAH